MSCSESTIHARLSKVQSEELKSGTVKYSIYNIELLITETVRETAIFRILRKEVAK